MRRQPWETAASPDYHNYSKMLTIAQNAEVWSSISYHFWQRGRTHDSQEVARVVALPATSNLLPAAQLPQSRLPLHAQVVLDPPHLHPPHLHPPHLTYTHLAHAHTRPHLHSPCPRSHPPTLTRTQPQPANRLLRADRLVSLAITICAR